MKAASRPKSIGRAAERAFGEDFFGQADPADGGIFDLAKHDRGAVAALDVLHCTFGDSGQADGDNFFNFIWAGLSAKKRALARREKVAGLVAPERHEGGRLACPQKQERLARCENSDFQTHNHDASFYVMKTPARPEEALKKGREEKSREFVEHGSEIYPKPIA